MCIYVGMMMMIYDFPGLLFWMTFLDDDDDWNHLTKTPYTTARKGRKKNFS
jgi:hypothetical protein